MIHPCGSGAIQILKFTKLLPALPHEADLGSYPVLDRFPVVPPLTRPLHYIYMPYHLLTIQNMTGIRGCLSLLLAFLFSTAVVQSRHLATEPEIASSDLALTTAMPLIERISEPSPTPLHDPMTP